MINRGVKMFPIKGRGFTLVEMSVVVVIIGLIIMTVFPALNATRTAAQRTQTESNLKSLLRAVAVYVQANGCLPCPMPSGVSGANFGRVRGDANSAPCVGCTAPEGIAPFVSLGIPSSAAKDGWGRWITMRIDPALAENFSVLPSGAAGMCKTGLASSGRISVKTVGGASQEAAVILVSHGANGHGAKIASAISGDWNGYFMFYPSSPPKCAAKKYEECNADENSKEYFVAEPASGTVPFDDVLLYADRNNLVAMFGNAVCQTAW